MNLSLVIQLILSGLVTGGVYCLVAYGFVLCWRVANLLNLAQASSGVFGAFICYILAKQGVSLWIGVPCGILFAGLLGLIAERTIVTPLRRWKIAAWLIAGLGGEIILRETMIHLWSSSVYRFPSLLGKEKAVEILGAVTTNDRLLLIFIVFVLVYGIETISDHTMWGKEMRATAHDEIAARLMGINTNRIVIAVFSLSAALCAVSVILQAPFTGLSCVIGFELVIKGFAVAIIGGLDSRRGAIISAVLIGLLESVGSIVVPAGYRDTFTFTVLIVVLILRPQGLFGKLELREV